MRKTRLYTALLLLGAANGAYALGLGEIEVSSDLFQPLRADIRIHGWEGVPLQNLRATLASENSFLRANLERPFFLRGLSMEVVQAADGEAMIRVTTNGPVREPMLEFLVDVEWPGGRLQRQYAVLLDPPVRAPEVATAAVAEAAPATPAEVPVQAERTAAATPAEAPAAGPRPVAAGEPATNAGRAALSAGSATATPPAAPRTYRVRRNDTLGRIAEQLRPDPSLTINQVMLALLDENPQAFAGNNINNLRQGAELVVPSPEQVARIPRGQATARVREQYAVWRAAREPRPVQPQQPAAPPTRVAEAPAQTPEGLRLVPTVAQPSRATNVGETSTGAVANNPLAQELERTRELLYEREAELDVLRSRMAIYENDLRELNKTVQALRDEVESNRTATVTAAPLPPPPEPATRGFDITPVLIGMLLALGGFGLFSLIYRLFRGRAPAASGATATATPLEIGQALPVRDVGPPPPEPAPEQTGRAEAPTERHPAPPDAAPAAAPAAAGPGGRPASVALAGDDDADVHDLAAGKNTAERLAVEVDVLLQFGFFQRARELLEAALDVEPENNEHRLKMLELCHAAEDTEGFVREARVLRDHLGEGEQALWTSAAAMAATLCPDDPLFNPAAVAARGSGRAAAEQPPPLAGAGPADAADGAEIERSESGPFHFTGELDITGGAGEPPETPHTPAARGAGDPQTMEWEFLAPAGGEPDVPARPDEGDERETAAGNLDDEAEELGEWILDEDLEHDADGTPYIDIDTSNWDPDETLGGTRRPKSQEELEATHQWAFSKEEARSGGNTEQLDFGDTQEIPPLLVDDLDEVLDDDSGETPESGRSTSEWSLTGELSSASDDDEGGDTGKLGSAGDDKGGATGEWHPEEGETDRHRKSRGDGQDGDTNLWRAIRDPGDGPTDEHPVPPPAPGATETYPAADDEPDRPEDDPDTDDGRRPGPGRRPG